MRHVGTVLIVASILAAAGCKKAPEGPQTTSLEPPSRQLDYLQPLESAPPQAAAETPPAAEAPPAAEQPQAAAAEPQAVTPRTYTIQKGDTLWSIARKHLGDPKRWKDIVAANPGLDTRKLSIGQKIVLPDK